VVAMGALRLPRPWNVVVLPVTSLAAGVSATIGGGNTSAAWGQALGLLGIGAAMVAMGEIMRTNRELVEARAEVARLAVADERERFARDLHDLLGHSLSVIALKAQLAQKRLPDDPETAAADVADIEAVTRDALREVRQAVSGYHRPALVAELEGARTALGAAGIDTTIDHPQVALPPDVEAVLAWTVREAATNVIRHSGARHSAIRVLPALGEAVVEVVDDGRGAPAENGSGHGLVGLEARVRDAGGRLEAGPREDGPGFRVRAVVPVESAR
jgi:two-component system, NarL family, sensor histidine kinase DesK